MCRYLAAPLADSGVLASPSVPHRAKRACVRACVRDHREHLGTVRVSIWIQIFVIWCAEYIRDIWCLTAFHRACLVTSFRAASGEARCAAHARASKPKVEFDLRVICLYGCVCVCVLARAD